MKAHRSLAVAIGLACSIAVAGCGLGPGHSIGGVTLTVTRDYGSTRILQKHDDDVSESETVMRLLDRSSDISTRYGGAFVQGIDGIEGGSRDGRLLDWFFYVNGVESSVGAADYELHDGDRAWWDYRDWTAAMRVPAVVGSFPEPFRHGYEGERHPVEIVCMGDESACALVRSRLRAAGVRLGGAAAGNPIRVLVGPWSRVRADSAAAQVEHGPSTSGVFADFEPGQGRYALEPLDVEADPLDPLGDRSGLIAATREGDDPPTWLVTGTDEAGTRAAARLLDSADLRDRFAVAVSGRREIPLPR